MSSSSRSVITLQLCALSLLSAFLLFQVQPVISKFILPWFGGSPGVWTTCVLFFQVVLFLGYTYAHLLTKLPRRWQLMVHGVLLLAAALSLPIAPGAQWKPLGGEDPTGRILMLLLANVALPYFVLSSTSPLVQVWFSRAGAGRAPWRLYALSNFGSLAALLTYPTYIEPRWDVMEQTRLWSYAFAAFALLSFAGAYADWKEHRATGAVPPPPAEILRARAPRWWQRILWLVLPAVASVLLLAATSHLCEDVAVIPFLWVVPLSLYLLTFIVCFEHERWYLRLIWVPLAFVLLYAAAMPDDFSSAVSNLAMTVIKAGHLVTQFKATSPNISWDVAPNFHWQIGLVCCAMFVGCMVCHGELARLKPDPAHLTEFYLVMSAGGALGGLFVSQAAPRLFQTYLEWPGALVAVMGVASIVTVFASWRTPNRWVRTVAVGGGAAVAGTAAWLFATGGSKAWMVVQKVFPLLNSPVWCAVIMGAYVVHAVYAVFMVALQEGWRWSRLASGCGAAAMTGFGVWWIALHSFTVEPRIARVRNFYGVISVKEDFNGEGEGWRMLYHGSILHGMQYLSPTWRNEPLSYYGHKSGIGLALLTLKDRPDARVGVVGMGTGTVAAYGMKGQVYRFYDINPDIVRFAHEHFHFLEDLEQRGGTVEIAMGDARLSLEHDPPQHFDALLLDAFSGDSVPVHLLTREAFEIYQHHMQPDGIIAVHVSNRYLALAPVIEKIAASIGMKTTRVLTELDGFDEATDYVLVTNNEAFLKAHPPEEPESAEPEAKTLWTDKRHNLFECLMTGN
jgi:hypothetical protein